MDNLEKKLEAAFKSEVITEETLSAAELVVEQNEKGNLRGIAEEVIKKVHEACKG